MSAPPTQPPPATPVIALTGDFQFDRSQRIVQSQIQSRMLVWCKAGRGRVICNGTVLPLEPKDAVFLPWNRELIYEADARTPFLVGGMHLIPHHDRAEPMRFYVPHAARDRFADVPFRQDRLLPGLEGILQARFQAADPLELLAEYLVAKFRHAAVGPTEPSQVAADVVEAAYTLAPIFLAEAARCFGRPVGLSDLGADLSGAHYDGGQGGTRTPVGALPADLVRLMRFIDNHVGNPIGLRELAQFSGLSRSNVGRLFRRYLKSTPVSWITRHKIAAAKRILSTGTTPIGQVGERVGITDPFYFSKLFKKETGLTAKAYRRAASLI